jgi:hypothetical protein
MTNILMKFFLFEKFSYLIIKIKLLEFSFNGIMSIGEELNLWTKNQ